MDDAEFTVISRNTLTPYRPRENLHDLVKLADGSARAAFVDPAVATSLRVRAHTARPNETGGLVLGRIFRDELGPYTLVLGFVEAPPGASSPGSIRMTPEDVAGLEETAAASYPGFEVVGWWHSHHGPSLFSRTDVLTQKLWTNESHVGLLVFATGSPWAIAYQGPTASLLESAVLMPPLSRAPMPTGSVPTNPKTVPANTYRRVLPSGSTRHPSMVGADTQKTVRVAAIAAAILVLGATAVALAFDSRAQEPNDTDINWTCRLTPTSTVTCEAVPVPVGVLEWVIGDTVVGTGALVRLPDSVVGTIALRIRRTAVTDLGSLDLATLPPASTTTLPPVSTTTAPPHPSTTVAPTPATTAPPNSTTTVARKPTTTAPATSTTVANTESRLRP